MPATDGNTEGPFTHLSGPAAIPREGSTLLFEAIWEANAFGLALALHECRVFEWNELRDRLIGEIADAEAQERPFSYYERWLAALERLLAEQGFVSPAELDARTTALAAGEAASAH